MRHIFYSDPGHGWLKVKRSDLIRYGIDTKISRCSYQSETGEFVYLEEDCDAALYFEAYKAETGAYPQYETKDSNKESFIRRLKDYKVA